MSQKHNAFNRTRKKFVTSSKQTGIHYGLKKKHAENRSDRRVRSLCRPDSLLLSEVQQKSQNNFDVVILGAGTGGLVTAIEAADLGLKPVVLEKMECSAGNSLYASGGIAAWGTSQQKEEGRNETKESFREDMMKVSEYRADPALVGAYVNHIPEDFEWLKSRVLSSRRSARSPGRLIIECTMWTDRV